MKNSSQFLLAAVMGLSSWQEPVYSGRRTQWDNGTGTK